MALTDELIVRLLPEGFPEGAPMSSEAEYRMSEFEDSMPESPLLRVLRWQDLLEKTVRENRDGISDTLTASGFDEQRFEFAVGFVPLSPADFLDDKINQKRRGTDYVFGGMLFDFSSTAFPVGSRLTSMDLGVFDDRLKGIPMLQKEAGLVLHAPPNLMNATATCWATSRTQHTPAPKDYILTAAHTVNWQNNSQNVSLSSGQQASIYDLAPIPIDAMLLDPGYVSKGTVTQLPAEVKPVAGERYEFTGLTSKAGVAGRLTTVNVTPGSTSFMTPDRIQLDKAGQSGDSGALVRSRESGKGLGIYSGLITTAQANYVISQGLEQVRARFDIDLWE